MTEDKSIKDVDHYGAQYGSFETDLLAEVRGEAFGEDIGQNGWLTAPEQDLFIEFRMFSRNSVSRLRWLPLDFWLNDSSVPSSMQIFDQGNQFTNT